MYTMPSSGPKKASPPPKPSSWLLFSNGSPFSALPLWIYWWTGISYVVGLITGRFCGALPWWCWLVLDDWHRQTNMGDSSAVWAAWHGAGCIISYLRQSCKVNKTKMPWRLERLPIPASLLQSYQLYVLLKLSVTDNFNRKINCK